MKIEAVTVHARVLKRADPQWRTSSYKADELGGVYMRTIEAGGTAGTGASASHPRRITVEELTAQLREGVAPALTGRPLADARRAIAGLPAPLHSRAAIAVDLALRGLQASSPAFRPRCCGAGWSATGSTWCGWWAWKKDRGGRGGRQADLRTGCPCLQGQGRRRRQARHRPRAPPGAGLPGREADDRRQRRLRSRLGPGAVPRPGRTSTCCASSSRSPTGTPTPWPGCGQSRRCP